MQEEPISGVAVRIGVVGGSNLTALLALNSAVLANLTLHEPLAIDSARDFNVTYAELLSTVRALGVGQLYSMFCAALSSRTKIYHVVGQHSTLLNAASCVSDCLRILRI